MDPAEVLTSIEARESFPVPGGMCGFDGEGSTSVSKNAITKWQGLRVGADTLDVALVSLHLKAFPTDPRSCAQREAQATLARIAVEQLAAEGGGLALLRCLHMPRQLQIMTSDLNACCAPAFQSQHKLKLCIADERGCEMYDQPHAWHELFPQGPVATRSRRRVPQRPAPVASFE